MLHRIDRNGISGRRKCRNVAKNAFSVAEKTASNVPYRKVLEALNFFEKKFYRLVIDTELQSLVGDLNRVMHLYRRKRKLYTAATFRNVLGFRSKAETAVNADRRKNVNFRRRQRRACRFFQEAETALSKSDCLTPEEPGSRAIFSRSARLILFVFAILFYSFIILFICTVFTAETC